MNRVFARAIVVVALAWAAPANAGTVTVDLEATDAAQFAAAMGISIEELESQLTDEINEVYNVLRAEDYMRALADAQAFSSRGLGVDYASNPKLLSIGVTANATVGFGDEGFDEPQSDQPIVNLATNISIMAGINLNVLNKPRFKDVIIYVNAFSYKANITDEIEARMTNIGAHVQYKFFRREDRLRHGIFQWGGIDVTGGIEYAQMGISLERDELGSDLGVDGSTTESNVTFDGRGTFDIDTKTVTLPIEASTNVRLLTLLSLFGGLGIDLQMGGNDMKVQLDGTLTGEDPSGGADIEIGTAHVEIDESSGPSRGKLRFFGGAQLNAWRLKVFIQLNVAPDRAVGFTFGSRVAW